LAIDQDIIEVYCTENIEVWVQGFVDIFMKGWRCICESKGHNQGFKEAIAGEYASLSEILISYQDKVKAS
jgi:hypothetical protein